MAEILHELFPRCSSRSALFRPLLEKVLKRRPARIAIEYSSPNIAKPFHVGHLRSTLIGQFLANLFEAAGHDVIRLNWLGDWGTQFGLLARGYREYGSDVALNEHGVRHLFDVYVLSNTLANEDPTFYEEAKAEFQKLEQGDKTALEFWQRAKDVSVAEFQALYQKLDVTFDHMDFESQYASTSRGLVADWLKEDLLVTREDGRVGLWTEGGTVDKPGRHGLRRFVTLQKSDESSLYLSRDLAALLDRQRKYNFQRIIYVVGAEQTDHFKDMKTILLHTGHGDLANCVEHVGFRKVQGLSSRQGHVVFVNDLLNRGRQMALDYTKGSANARLTPESEDAIADALALSAWIIWDFSHARNTAFRYSWTNALRQRGDTGTFLQFSHARLCSLEERCAATVGLRPDSAGLHLLAEPTAQALLAQLAELGPAVCVAYTKMEARELVDFCFKLANKANAAHQHLRVLDQKPELASARLLMFATTRRILGHVLSLLGVKPLEKM